MDTTITSADDVKIIAFAGRLDTHSSPQAQAQISQLIEDGGRKIVVNLVNLDYISSAGLRVCLATAKQLKAVDGQLRICGLNEVVGEVFDVSGFSMIFSIFERDTDALEGF